MTKQTLEHERPYTRAEIIYVLTRADVDGVAEQNGLPQPDEDAYRWAQKAVESFFGENWSEVIKIGLEYHD